MCTGVAAQSFHPGWRASLHPGLKAQGGGHAPHSLLPCMGPRRGLRNAPPPLPPLPPPQHDARVSLPPPPSSTNPRHGDRPAPPPPRPADAAGCALHAWQADMQSRRDSHRAPPRRPVSLKIGPQIKSNQPPHTAPQPSTALHSPPQPSTHLHTPPHTSTPLHTPPNHHAHA